MELLAEAYPILKIREVDSDYDPRLNLSLNIESGEYLENRRRVLLNCFLALHLSQ